MCRRSSAIRNASPSCDAIISPANKNSMIDFRFSRILFRTRGRICFSTML